MPTNDFVTRKELFEVMQAKEAEWKAKYEEIRQKVEEMEKRMDEKVKEMEQQIRQMEARIKRMEQLSSLKVSAMTIEEAESETDSGNIPRVIALHAMMVPKPR